MAEITHVNPQEMLQIAKTIASDIDQWEQSVTDIFKLQGELDAMWDGTANDAFNKQWEEDRKKYQSLTELMHEYCTAIETAANLYIEREAEVTQIVNS